MACGGWGIAAIDWGHGGAHPKSFLPSEVTPKLIHRMRGAPTASTAQQTAGANFVSCSSMEVVSRGCGDLLAVKPPMQYVAAADMPRLTARKFPAESASAVMALFEDCANGLMLLGSRQCPGAPI